MLSLAFIASSFRAIEAKLFFETGLSGSPSFFLMFSLLLKVLIFTFLLQTKLLFHFFQKFVAKIENLSTFKYDRHKHDFAHDRHDNKIYQGPVVKSIVILTSSLRRLLVKYNGDYIIKYTIVRLLVCLFVLGFTSWSTIFSHFGTASLVSTQNPRKKVT